MINLTPELVLEIMNDAAGGADGGRHSRTAKTIERLGFEMLAENEGSLIREKSVTVVGGRVGKGSELRSLLFAHQKFSRANPRHRVQKRLLIARFHQAKFARGQISVGETVGAIVCVN